MAAAVAGALLLWLLGAVMFFWVADRIVGLLPDLGVSKRWRSTETWVRAVVCLLWWLLVLWQLADEVHKRWRQI